jgi:hypothetical protein
LVCRWWRDLEIACHVRFGRRTAVEFGIVVDERQKLPLPRRVLWLIIQPSP